MIFPFSAKHSSAFTCQRLAAAVTSISRADAPMVRINSKKLVVLSLLPVNCQLIRGLRYDGATVENSTFTRLQSAPSSSARTAGSVVMIPWPISDWDEMSVTSSLGLIRIQALRGMSLDVDTLSSDATRATSMVEAEEGSEEPIG